MRALTILLTIATLLACPYGCLGELGGSTSAVSASPPCCGKCSPASLPARDDQLPSGDSCGLACLCEGAVLVANGVDLEPPEEVLFERPLDDSVALSHAAATAFFSDVHEGCSLHGSSLRIALRSFLC
jgi:hypothetical protein